MSVATTHSNDDLAQSSLPGSVERVLYRWVAVVGAVTLAVMALYIVANVLMRYLLGEPLLAVTELTSRWLLVLAVYAGLVLALRKDEHVRVGLLTENLSGVALKLANHWRLATTVLFMLAVLIFGAFGATEAARGGEYGIDSGLPLWPARYFVPLFSGLMLLAIVLGLSRQMSLGRRRSGAAVSDARAKLSISTVVTAGCVLTSVLLGAMVMLGNFERTQIAWMVILLAGTLLMSGAYVGVAMGMAAGVGLLALEGERGLSSALERLPYESSATWTLTVIPMFVVMGMLLGKSGATDSLFAAAQRWIGWIPGGLAVTTNTTGAALGAASGSTMAIAHALGRVGIPAMLAAGYPKRLAISSVLMSGSTSQLIPPSILLVLYAGVAGTSVGAQLLSGIVPGLILAALFSVILIFMAINAQRKVGRKFDAIEATWAERLAALKDVWAIPVLILAVVGGIYFGVFTATEAGAMGAAVAALLAVQRLRSKSWAVLARSAVDTISAVGSIFLLFIGAALLSRFLAFSGLTLELASFVEGIGLGRVSLLLALVLLYIVMGMFMEPLSMMLLSVPILIPIVEALDVNLIWFGVFVVLLGELAQVTPPVGLLLYVVQGLCKDPQVSLGQFVSSKDVMIASLYFVPGALLVAVLLIFFPDLVHLLEPQL